MANYGVYNADGSLNVKWGPSVTTSITAAQLVALADSPVTLVPAPGVGNAIVVASVFNEFTAGTNPFYTAGSTTVYIAYNNSDSSYKFNSNVYYNTTSTKFLESVNLLEPSSLAGIDFSKIDNKALILSGSNLNLGSIATSTKGAGGSGYAVNDTGLITTGNGDAVYVVDTVSAGAVLTYHLSNAGTGYDVSNGQATSVSTGTGNGAFTVNVTAITQGDGTAKISFTYHIVSKP